MTERVKYSTIMIARMKKCKTSNSSFCKVPCGRRQTRCRIKPATGTYKKGTRAQLLKDQLLKKILLFYRINRYIVITNRHVPVTILSN